MKNLPSPLRDNDRTDLRRGVRSYRYRGQLQGHTISDDEVEQVITLYDHYEAESGAASEVLKGGGLQQVLREAIDSAYDRTQKGRMLASLRERLFEGVEQCPICGINAADELDHHLPKSVFKPLAIHARNLVPMCHSCNNRKLEVFGDNNTTGFLHPYYDVLPNLQFLCVAARIQDGALVITYSIDAAADLPEGWIERLSHQFETLNLDDRYQKEINSYVTSHAASLHLTFKQNGQGGVRTMLRLQAQFEITVFHRNHWRPVLLLALADLDDFTNGGFADVLPIPAIMIEDMES